MISCDLCLNFLKCPKSRCVHELTAAIASFTDINVSQRSVATLFRCGGIINNQFIANFPQSVLVKEFLKSVNIWRRYGQKYGGMFFLTHSVYSYKMAHDCCQIISRLLFQFASLIRIISYYSQAGYFFIRTIHLILLISVRVTLCSPLYVADCFMCV